MEATVDIGGNAYTLASDDNYLANMGASFEPETVKLLKILAHGVALDVGANIGCTALAMAADSTPKCSAFERPLEHF
ncbi:hypothetical protein, partial [Rhodanobacter thiooxydans]|uniref:hypothetical protein n=1 Tax=Rhodanobacter thiooxydans TaxID=416169 RepID=UPI000AA6A466